MQIPERLPAGERKTEGQRELRTDGCGRGGGEEEPVSKPEIGSQKG